MFQFTREFIINDNEGKLAGGKKFVGEDGILKVDHMINIKAKDVCSAYKSEGEAEALEVLEITPADTDAVIKKGDVVRLVLTLGQDGRVISTFNDQYPEHSRSFFYEAKAAADATVPVADLVDAIKKEAALFESPFFTAEEAAGKLTLKALDCYTRFNEVRIVKVPTDDQSMVGAVLTGYLDYEVVVALDRKALLDGGYLKTEGSTGKNTTNYIVHNMRLLTGANINPYGVNIDERPLPKSIYDQYTLELVTERRHIGHQVMGAVDQSLVTVIFFVLHTDGACADSPSALFEAALTEAGIKVEDVAKKQPVKRIVALDKDVKKEESSSES